jgi:hypothetical protein
MSALGLDKSDQEVDREAQDLAIIRGIQLQPLSEFRNVVAGTVFEGQKELRLQLHKVYAVARLTENSDCGRELQSVTKEVLQRNPALVQGLHEVATSNTLFGVHKSVENAAQFEKIRREYLVDLINGAASQDRITQGAGPMCTVTSLVEDLKTSEFLKLGCEFATKGKATLASGREVTMDVDRFYDRGIKNSTCAVHDLKSRRPAAGTLMLLDGLMTAGCAVPDANRGAYWNEYVNNRRNLQGTDAAGMARDAKVLVDSTNQAVKDRSTAVGPVRELNQMEYLKARLTGEPPKAVPIDTLFNFSGSKFATGAEHARHMMLAERITTGQELVKEYGNSAFGKHQGTWIECDNPIGDFMVGGAKVKPGEILGDKQGFWFVTGENGKIYVRPEVLEKNLQVVVVDYADKYTAPTSGVDPEPTLLGTLPSNEGYRTFVPGEDYLEGLDTAETVSEPRRAESTEHESYYAPEASVETHSSKDEGEVRSYGRSRRAEEEELQRMRTSPDVGTFEEKKRSGPDQDERTSFVQSTQKTADRKAADQPPPAVAETATAASSLAGNSLLWGFSRAGWKPTNN